jgi:cysteine desulfurase / selenocysteine lyase
VTFETSTYNELPYKFEAGTPNIAGAVGLAAAIDYVRDRARRDRAHEQDLLAYGTALLGSGRPARRDGARKASILSFVMDGIHPHDIGTIVDREGVAIRTGHHCAQPVMDRFGVPATARARSRCTTRARTSTRSCARSARPGGVRVTQDFP